jgi:hypothetical protein
MPCSLFLCFGSVSSIMCVDKEEGYTLDSGGGGDGGGGGVGGVSQVRRVRVVGSNICCPMLLERDIKNCL